MNKGVLGVGIILLGAIALLIITVISNYSTGSEVDYYLVKETSEAAMTDALDESFLAMNGVPRIDKQVFMESFLLRFADNVADTRSYNIGFYGINEVPPVVSVKVDSSTLISVQLSDGEKTSETITTSITQLVESKETSNPALTYEFHNPKSTIGAPVTGEIYNSGNGIKIRSITK